MAWLEISIDTAPETIEDVAAKLTAGGFPELLIEDEAEFQDFLDQNKAYWDYIDEELQEKLQGLSRIKLYLEEEQTKELAQLQELLASLGLEARIETMAQTDWDTAWQDSYPPQPIGDTLVVLPCWRPEEDAQGRLPVILDPGLTFGTGAHASTQMVMEAMEKAELSGKTCLDLGSGSGILSLAALRLGAETAVGVDIDPKAEDIARENAAYNGYAAPEFTALTGNVLSDKKLMETLEGQWDMVLVNIVADVIVALAPVLPRFLGADSKLILSGILDSRLADVQQALTRAGLTITATHEKQEWRCLEARI